MNTQINLRLPTKMMVSAKGYVKKHGYKNIQDFITETVRERLYPIEYEKISPQEMAAVRKLIERTDRKNRWGTEEELFKALRKR